MKSPFQVAHALAGLVQTHASVTTTNYSSYRDTESMRPKIHVKCNRKKKKREKKESEEKKETIFHLGKKIIFDSQYGFAVLMP